jgi:hypothetical protein
MKRPTPHLGKPKSVAKLVFDTDYTNRAAVIRLCKALGGGGIVIKHAGRMNYNIVHHTRRDRWDIPGVDVVWWPDRFGPLPEPKTPTITIKRRPYAR